MRILFIHQQYSSSIGGEDIALDVEIRALKKKYGNKNVRAKIYKGSLGISKLIHFFDLIIPVYSFLIILYEKVWHKVQIIHFHNIWPWLSPSIIIFAKFLGIKTIATLHNYRTICIADNLFRKNEGACTICANSKTLYPGVAHGCYKGKINSAFKYIVISLWKIWGYPERCDAILTLSEFQQKIFKDYYSNNIKEKVLIKSNLIKVQNKINEYEENIKRSGYLYAGRLEKGKGIEVLLREWSALSIDSSLHIIGTGPLESKLKSVYDSSKNIFFHGNKQHNEVLSMMSNVRFVICPSIYYETFGLTIFEAYSMGTPVIGFDIGTRSEFIINGVTGIKTSPKKLGTTIQNSIKDLDYRRYRNNCIQFMKKFSNEIIINRQIKMYNKILKDN